MHDPERVEVFTGSGSGQTFDVQNWGGTVSLTGMGSNDQFAIALVGSGSSAYSACGRCRRRRNYARDWRAIRR